MFANRAAIGICDSDPFGEVTLVPALISGRSESRLARAMAEALANSNPSTASQALQRLRMMFPDSPLTVRVAALDALTRR